jgi:hypothetical protein
MFLMIYIQHQHRVHLRLHAGAPLPDHFPDLCADDQEHGDNAYYANDGYKDESNHFRNEATRSQQASGLCCCSATDTELTKL